MVKITLLARKNAGFGMVELAVGILILGVVFAGIARLLVSGTRSGSNTANVTRANQIANFIYQRMNSNLESGQALNYLEGGGNGNYAGAATLPSCANVNNCTQAELAAIDLFRWKQLFTQSSLNIPNLKGTICYSSLSSIPTINSPNCSGSSANPIVIKLAWDSAESDQQNYMVVRAPSALSMGLVSYSPAPTPTP